MRRILNNILLSLVLATHPLPALADAEIGKPISTLRATELDGTYFDLLQFRGSVVLVHFWATWCSSCRAEMPVLDAAYQKYHTNGLMIIGVSVDRADDREEVVRTMKSLHFPTTMLNNVESSDFGKPRLLPVTYVIDRSGLLQGALVPSDEGGALTDSQLNALLDPLLLK